MPAKKKSSSDDKNADDTDELDEEEDDDGDEDDESDSTSSSVRAYQRREIELLEKINSQLALMSSTHSDESCERASGTDSQRN
jgi:hypothetical protein